MLHDFAFTDDSSHRITIRNRFGKDSHIGNDSEDRLDSAGRESETGRHFVENQDNIVGGSQLANLFEVTVRRHFGAKRFHHDRGDFAGVFLE